MSEEVLQRMDDNQEVYRTKNPLLSFSSISLIISVAIIICVTWYLNWLFALGVWDIKSSAEQMNLGTIGDSFGLVNSLFSGVAILGLFVAILFQRSELKEVKADRKDTQSLLVEQKRQFKEQERQAQLRHDVQVGYYHNQLEHAEKQLSRQSSENEISKSEARFFQLLEIFKSTRENLSYQISPATYGLKALENHSTHILNNGHIAKSLIDSYFDVYIMILEVLLKHCKDVHNLHENTPAENASVFAFVDIMRSQIPRVEVHVLKTYCTGQKKPYLTPNLGDFLNEFES